MIGKNYPMDPSEYNEDVEYFTTQFEKEHENQMLNRKYECIHRFSHYLFHFK